MTKYGGYNILSMKKIQTLSQQDTVQGPYNVIYLGGEAVDLSSSCYKQISKKIKEPSIVYEVENMWKSVALISQAEAVLSTSLHVRIIAFLCMRPRLTWCGHEPKHPQFIAL